MVRILGRSPTTASRELRRNSSAAGYACLPAQALSAARRSAGRRPTRSSPCSVCWRIVLSLFEWRWLPRRISGTLKRVYPTDPTQQVSQDTIYTPNYAQPCGELRRHLIACLRYGHSSRMPHTHEVRTGVVRFRTWSAFVCDRPKSKNACCPDIGRTTSTRTPATSPRSACWLEGLARWCCLRKWRMPPPHQRWRASAPNSIRLPSN
jgi:IS30 family transposase